MLDTKKDGDQCATQRLLELEETDTCNVVACPRGILHKNGEKIINKLFYS